MIGLSYDTPLIEIYHCEFDRQYNEYGLPKICRMRAAYKIRLPVINLFLLDADVQGCTNVNLLICIAEPFRFELHISLCSLDRKGNLCHLNKKVLRQPTAEILRQIAGEGRHIV
jgi:hypothetical protein